MPYYARSSSFRELLADSECGKHLLVAHDVLLIGAFYFTIYFFLHFNVCYAILDDKEQSLRAAHGGKHTVRRSIDAKIGLILRCMMNNLTVEVCQDLSFFFLVDFLIWIIRIIRCYREIGRILLTEAIEGGVSSCSSAIESSLDRNYSPHRIVLHIIRKYHQLCDVDEATKLFVWETLLIHSLAFSYNSSMIVWLFYLYEAKRQAIDKQSNVWAEFILPIFTSEFSGKMKSVVLRIFKVYQFDGRYSL